MVLLALRKRLLAQSLGAGKQIGNIIASDSFSYSFDTCVAGIIFNASFF